MSNFMGDPGRIKLFSFFAGLVVIVAFATGLLLWANQPQMTPLFSGLNERDASEVLTQLEEMKVPYQISADGKAILVDRKVADETRIKLDGRGLAVNGGEGFELFDDADYGMTEFVQKINYQRALQGELSRTINALDEVRYARVHLVLPERGLFRAPENSAKASITLIKQPGLHLGATQIAGIQQMVASAVDGMAAEAVTVLDERGVVISQGVSEADSEPRVGLSRKQEVEEYLTSKANKILSQVFGTGASVVKIDVSLNLDNVQMTRESWQTPDAAESDGLVASSSVQRKFSETAGEANEARDNTLASESVEMEYRINKTVEQVVKREGAIDFMTVSVLVPADTSADKLDAVQGLVATAVGFRADRGDIIRVIPLSLNSSEEMPPGSLPALQPLFADTDQAPSAVKPETGANPINAATWTGFLWLAAGAIVAFVLLSIWPRQQKTSLQHLSDNEKSLLLEEVQTWFADGSNESVSRPKSVDSV